MSRLFYHTMQDNVGNLLFDVSGTMRLAGSGTLATIYGDEALTVILPNPMTNHPSFGSFKCFLPVGDFDFYMAKSGYTFETLTGVQGYGSMAQQEANAVTITGGTAAFTGTGPVLQVSDIARAKTWQVIQSEHPTGNDVAAFYTDLAQAGGTGRNAIACGGDAPCFFNGHLLLRAGTVDMGGRVNLVWSRPVEYGIVLKATADSGASTGALLFANSGGTPVGSITQDATTTAYNTTSDARLKHDVHALTGELALVQALRPVAFLWNADDTPGYGFLASEVQQVLPNAGIITGLADAIDEEGRILPQMIDYSKLVPFLTGAVKTLAAQVESLTARLVVLEDALGI